MLSGVVARAWSWSHEGGCEKVVVRVYRWIVVTKLVVGVGGRRSMGGAIENIGEMECW